MFYLTCKSYPPILAFIIFFIFITAFILAYNYDLPVTSFNMVSYKKVSLVESGLTFEIPKTTVPEESVSFSDEILLHMVFFDPVLKFHGMLQKWRIGNLNKFLSESKKKSSLNIQNYRLYFGPKRNTAILFYEQFREKDAYTGREYYIPAREEEVYYRWAFFVPTADYKEEYDRIFRYIVDSVREF